MQACRHRHVDEFTAETLVAFRQLGLVAGVEEPARRGGCVLEPIANDAVAFGIASGDQNTG